MWRLTDFRPTTWGSRPRWSTACSRVGREIDLLSKTLYREDTEGTEDTAISLGAYGQYPRSKRVSSENYKVSSVSSVPSLSPVRRVFDKRIYSDRSALITSTRDARAAGVTDATIAAMTSTAAAAAIGTTPGICTSPTKLPDQAREHHTADRAGDDAADADGRALAEDAREQMPRRRSNRQPHAELARARAHREREHAGHADHRDEQRDAREAAEDQRVHAVRRQHLRANVVERRRALHRLIARQLADDLRHRRHAACTDRPSRG